MTENAPGGHNENLITPDGGMLKEYPLKAEPVFDGMTAAYGKLYLALKNGSVICLDGK